MQAAWRALRRASREWLARASPRQTEAPARAAGKPSTADYLRELDGHSVRRTPQRVAQPQPPQPPASSSSGQAAARAGSDGRAFPLVADKASEKLRGDSSARAAQLHREGNELYAKGDAAGAYKLWTQSAAAGDWNGEYSAALCQMQGAGVGRDTHAAAQRLASLASKGHPFAQLALGRAFDAGVGVAEDKREALTLLLLAGHNGLTTAFVRAAALLESGEGTESGEPDAEAALVLLRKGVDAGDAECAFQLATRYYRGQGTKQDHKRAFELNERAAAAGLAKAAFNVGCHYFLGHGVGRDDQRAAEHFERAARGGIAQAAVNLGNMYLEGRGVPQNQDTGLHWLRMAEPDIPQVRDTIDAVEKSAVAVEHEMVYGTVDGAGAEGTAPPSAPAPAAAHRERTGDGREHKR